MIFPSVAFSFSLLYCQYVFPENYIVYWGARALADALKYNTSLHTLDLDSMYHVANDLAPTKTKT
jgi:hypothetical protein